MTNSGPQKGAELARRLEEGRAAGRFGPLAVAAALLLALATFVVFAGFTPVIPTPFVVLVIFGSNALIILILLVLIALETRNLIAARRAGRAGAQASYQSGRALHARRGHSGSGDGGGCDRFARTGSKPGLHERHQRIYQRNDASHQPLSRIPMSLLVAGHSAYRHGSRAGRAAFAIGSAGCCTII